MELLKQKILKPLPVSLRSRIGEKRYRQAKEKGNTRPLVYEKRLREWRHWALIDNEYPYDYAFKTHHMLIPKRVVSREGLSQAEKDEYEKIMNELSDDYDCVLINFPSKQSVKNHFHAHLMRYKTHRNELSI